MTWGGADKTGRRYSMSQLDKILETEQPAYRAAAEQQVHETPRVRTALRGLTLATCVAVGLVLTVGAQQLTVGSPAEGDHRERLVASIKQQQARVAAQETRRDALQRDVGELRREGQGAADARLDRAVATAAAGANYAPVAGEGVVLVLDDRNAVDTGADVSRVGKGMPPEKVGYRDLQIIVNALWRSGAEAVSVNGIRMTALSTIRFAGQAVIVDFTPLAPPYSVAAIGDPEALERGLTSGSVSTLRTTLQGYGVVFSQEAKDDIHLEAGRSDQVYSARPVETDMPAQAGEGSAP